MPLGFSSGVDVPFGAVTHDNKLHVLGSCEHGHSIAKRARCWRTAVPGNQDPLGSERLCPNVGYDQEWPARGEQGCLDYDLSFAGHVRAGLLDDRKVERSKLRAKRTDDVAQASLNDSSFNREPSRARLRHYRV